MTIELVNVFLFILLFSELMRVGFCFPVGLVGCFPYREFFTNVFSKTSTEETCKAQNNIQEEELKKT